MQPLQTPNQQSYQPSADILKKYADVLVNFALNSGQGVKPTEVVEILVPDVAKPLALALQNTTLQAGAYPRVRLLPTGFEQDYYSLASDDQLTFFPEKYLKARVDLIDHRIQIIADPYPEQLQEIEPHKIIKARDSHKLFRDWLNQKETEGNFTWTLALWGVEAKAEKVGLTLENYWQQIIQACYLDQVDPIARWQQTAKLQEEIKQKLNSLPIKDLKIKGPDADIRLTLGQKRAWRGGSGRNIPSFEIFTSPDWRGTEGWMKFNEPVYRYGNLIQDVYLEFEKGRVVKGRAQKGNSLLEQMLKSPNADKLGEVSLTDSRMSRITHPMAETLFDENIGGPQGNCHLAIGMAYQDCYDGQAAELSKEDWEELGFNDSAEHTDFVSTTERTVKAVLTDGSEKIIYQKGKFTL
ncbi:MAG: aminopeptidase [Candidatus Pacebacteria bacterium]|nr:aminopeptidase [Candidatus Paceibacterota bacterium]